jgi:single-strand DNA-binding protein
MIKLQAIGNLGKDCTINQVNQKSVINFSVAHTEKFKDAQGQQKDKTIWVECAYWTDRTGIAPYLKKGTSVYVEGTPDIRTYTTADGRPGTSLSLRVLSVQLLGGGDREQSPTHTPAASYSNAVVDEPSNDLPF